MTTPTPVTPNLPAIASRLLQIVADAVPDPPARQFRCIGLPVHDSEQIALTIGPMQPGQPGDARPGQYENTPNRLRSYAFVVEVARCVPGLTDAAKPPAPEALDASAAVHIADYQALDKMVRDLGFNSKVHDDQLQAVGVKAVAAGQITSTTPQGGFAAVRCQLWVTV